MVVVIGYGGTSDVYSKLTKRFAAVIALTLLPGCGKGSGSASSFHPPAPMAAPLERQRVFPNAPLLQRLADDGARVYLLMPSKDGTVATEIIFQDHQLGTKELSNLQGVKGAVFVRFRRCKFAPGALSALDGLENVESLFFEDTALDDLDLDGLHRLPRLRHVLLSGGPVTGHGLAFLETSRLLTTAECGGTSVGDELSTVLRQHNDLRELGLGGSQLTDAGVADLTEHKNLDTLNLNDCRVTNTGVASLVQLRNLRTLCLAGTSITNVALEDVASLPRLEFLVLDRTSITDDGMASVARLHGLKMLSINDTQVTDVGLRYLRPLRFLGSVYAVRTRATQEASQILSGNISIGDGSSQ